MAVQKDQLEIDIESGSGFADKFDFGPDLRVIDDEYLRQLQNLAFKQKVSYYVFYLYFVAFIIVLSIFGKIFDSILVFGFVLNVL